MHKLIRSSLLSLLTFLLLAQTLPSYAFGWPNNNDSMFPPAPAAKPYINLDGRGFIINGKRVFVVAGEMQYPRIPRAEWRDRLLRIKRAGYNTVQTYAFWNFAEPRQGQFDFTKGRRDLDAYLKLIHSLGMYAIVRIGPYINAEWDTGGLPVWLRFIPGLLPMRNNPQFYAAVTPYWNRLLPIIVKNQINHGGPIIMVQLENEHVLPNAQQPGYAPGTGGGTDLPNAYYKHYQQVVLKAGLQVPYFFSGLNHNDNPAGDEPFDTSQRVTPWYSTEFWTGWVGWYGVDAQKQRKLVRATWKVIAYGGAGYTHYIMAGGSDFHTWNNNEQAASYDFGAPIGQAGDLRSDYYPLKHAAMFATSFPKVLANSLSAADGGGLTATNPAVQITSRSGPQGKIAFLDNGTYSPEAVQVKTAHGKLYPSAGPMMLASGEFVPIVHGYPILPNVSLDLGAARILGIAKQGNTTTLVIYGKDGEPGELLFHVPPHGVKLLQTPHFNGDSFTHTSTEIDLKTRFTTGHPRVFVFSAGNQRIRVLSMTTDLARRTWFVPVDGKMEIVCGPDYVGEAGMHRGRIVLDTEQAGLAWRPPPYPRLVFGADGALPLTSVMPPDTHPAPATPPALGAWQEDAAVPQAQPNYNVSHWLHTDQPQPMGADGGYGAYAWYRTTIIPPAAGTYQLDISDAGDWLTVFVNGQRQDSTSVIVRYLDPVPRQLTIHLKSGPNTIALLAAHYGRNKLFNYYGPMNTIDAKGISGTVTLVQQNEQRVPITQFRWKADDNGPNDAATLAAPGHTTTGPSWHNATTSTDVFQGRVGYAWFRTTLPPVPGPHRELIFQSIDDYGTVYLNGKLLQAGIGINQQAHVNLGSAWNATGQNTLAVLVQNLAGPGGLLGPITLVGGIHRGIVIHNWWMHGGEARPASSSPHWQPVAPHAAPNVPVWYRATFTATPPAVVGPHPILRVQTSTLSRGFVWLNGHNLGRYPEVSRYDSGQGELVDGVYLQECWLKPGKNILMIFDEDGLSPDQVKIIVEQDASRRDYVLETQGIPK